MAKYKFFIHKINRQSNYLKLELRGRCISCEFNKLGGKIIARFFTPKGVKITKEIHDAFVARAAELLKRDKPKSRP